MKKVTVIGSGFSGLSAAAFLAKAGLKVTIIEQNEELGGRARMLKSNGFSFDMGPSWYWMPDIFDDFFKNFELQTNNLYKLIQLDPGFKMIFDSQELEVPLNFNKTCEIFENYEKGAAKKLKDFMKDAKKKYDIGIDFMNNAPGVSLMELLDKKILLNLTNFEIFTSYRKHIKKHFKHPHLISLLEFPVLFLGASAENMPALYSLMAYSGIKQGTFYPKGGFNQVIIALVNLCKNLGVEFLVKEKVLKINIKNKETTSVTTNKNDEIVSDFILASADYAHVEKHLLKPQYRNYSEKYWEKRKFSPSSLIFYLGLNKKIHNLIHHNLFFDENIEEFTKDIYEFKSWPKKPLFYVCCPSKTDQALAPKGNENIFILMPIPIGVNDTEELREKYFDIIINRLEKYCNQKIKKNIIYKKSYCIKDFQNDYNAYKGNAYGLANTLLQTANLKPKIYNKKLKNLYYTGQLTVPGPGVPPSLISGKIVAEQIIKSIK